MTWFRKIKDTAKFLFNKGSAAVKHGRGAINKVKGLMAKGNQYLDRMGLVGDAIRELGKKALEKQVTVKGRTFTPQQIFKNVERGVEAGERAIKRGDRILKGDRDELRRFGDEVYTKARKTYRQRRARRPQPAF